MLMSAGPKAVDPTSPTGRVRPERLGSNEQSVPDKKDAIPPDDSQDAVIHISARAAQLSQALTAAETEQKLQAHSGLPVYSRKTAEAIMKKLAPDLYQALVDAGEIEE